MDIILPALLIAGLGGAVSALVLAYPAWDEKAYSRYKEKWNQLEYVSFRGQHFKHLKKGRIAKALIEFAEGFGWVNTNPRNIHPSTFEIKVRDSKKRSNLYLRCSVETYGAFTQIHYEWSGDPQAISYSKSAECLAVQDFVNRVERSLCLQDLQRSRFTFKLGGSKTFSSGTFNPGIVRQVLNNAIAAVDENGDQIQFRASPERRKNQWSDVVESYLLVENRSELQLRFYSVDRSASGSTGWDLTCDWKGSLDAMLNTDSSEWQVVRALFYLVQNELEKAGASPCIAADGYQRTVNKGIFEAWDSKVIEKALRSLANEYIGQNTVEHYHLTFEKHGNVDGGKLQSDAGGATVLVPDYTFMRFQMNGSRQRKKRVAGSIELEIKHWRSFSKDVIVTVPILHDRLDVCFQFLPLPPKNGEVILAWSAKPEDMEDPASSAACLFQVVENRLQSKLHKNGVRAVSELRTRSIEFLPESSESEAVQARDSWPSPQDFNESVQSPELCFADSDLISGELSMTTLGIPKAASGAFASVYKVSGANKDWALRCFNVPVKDQLLRYEKTSKFICSDSLPYTVWCEYLERGVRVGPNWYPVVKMDWVEGTPFSTYIAGKLSDRESLRMLREKFAQMIEALQNNGIAHGDLQHGNIIVRDDELVLVDYDNFFVAELAGLMSWETGHRNYQHPRRNSTDFGAYLDYFSAWIIDSALLCLIHDPQLWNRFGAGEENLLFTSLDFMDPADSELLQLMTASANPELSARAHFLRSLLDMEVSTLPAFQYGE